MNVAECLSCDSRTQVTPQGLCSQCRDDLRFVIRPAAHREAHRRHVAAAGIRAELERRGVVVDSGVPEDNSLWICDLCNSRIPVDDEYTLIPLLGSYALCVACATTLPYWPDGWNHPTPRACRCGACQTPLLGACLTTPQRTSRDGPAPDRRLGR